MLKQFLCHLFIQKAWLMMFIVKKHQLLFGNLLPSIKNLEIIGSNKKMKIIKRAIKLSYDRFKPNPYQRRYHFAIAIDENKPIKIDHKAYKIGQRFNISKYQQYPYSHAESHLISKLLDRYNTIRTDWSLVVLRINRQGRILLSKPCENCQTILDSLGLTKIYWSIDKNTFGYGSKKLIQV